MSNDGTVRLLWTASRDWIDPVLMWDVLSECHDWAYRQRKTLVVVAGDAGGGDQIPKLYAHIMNGVEYEAHPANWEGPCDPLRCKAGHRRRDRRGREYCPAAGDYRNEEMIALGAARCAAFIRDGSHGASNCAQVAKRAGIPTRRFTA